MTQYNTHDMIKPGLTDKMISPGLNHTNQPPILSCMKTTTPLVTDYFQVLLLDAWRVCEKEKGDSKAVECVEGKLPRKIKKRRMVTGEDGQELGWEEYYDFIFPDDQAAPTNLKILEMAQKWKQQKKRKADEV